jgi:tRNA pseudouridine65 synthase
VYPSETRLRTLYRDENLVAIDKPPGLLVHRSPIDARETVFALQLLRDQIGQPVYPCHRLDRPTSGVFLFALHPDALRHIQKELAEKRCEKTYQAAVRGWTPDQACIDDDLRSEENSEKVWDAVTRYRTLNQSELLYPVGRYPTARLSHIELNPETGRKHQLRRHMAHIRHPILGDTRHGDGAQNRLLREICSGHGLMLRATSLTIRPEPNAAPLCIHAPKEAPFYDALTALGLR